MECAVGAENRGVESDNLQRELSMHAIGGVHHGIHDFHGLCDGNFVRAPYIARRADRRAGQTVSLFGRDVYELAIIVEKQITFLPVGVHKGHLAVAGIVDLCAELHAPDHFILLHGTSGEDEKLVARFGEALPYGKTESVCLNARIARCCAIDHCLKRFARSCEHANQKKCQDRQKDKREAPEEADMRPEGEEGRPRYAQNIVEVRHAWNLATGNLYLREK